ncbi:MAG: membrane protein insertion efficiency factor YidD [Alphaproteobacteria bacterium]|nr:membrane protein insertion efficiency factor YidD [Alphaproteobacteria bacterium]
MKRVALWLVKAYQYTFSGFMGRSCRFYPTCSAYVVESVRRFGFWRGAVLALCRIGRCHPFHPGGHDPVPSDMRRFSFFPLHRLGNGGGCGKDSALHRKEQE